MSALKALMTDESLHLCRLTFRSDILSLAECKYQHEDRVEEQQAESETYALAEGLGKSEYQHDGVNDVDKALPAGLTRLFEDDPHRDD